MRFRKALTLLMLAMGLALAPPARAQQKPLSQVQVLALLAGQVPSHRVAMLVNKRGLDFEPRQDYVDEVRICGGDDELITALKSAKVAKLLTVDPASQARQTEARQHLARGAELAKKGQYAEAEREYRAALLLDSRDADLDVSLAYVLIEQKKLNDAAAAAREGLRLDPHNDSAHAFLGFVLEHQGDWDGAIVEYREALRLNPDNHFAHAFLGIALGNKGDLDGAIAEYLEALRLNPDDENAHANLGMALGGKGNRDGGIAEFREALRLNPKNGDAHYKLGNALEQKGDRRGALQEYRAAYLLDPKNVTYKRNYERLLQQLND